MSDLYAEQSEYADNILTDRYVHFVFLKATQKKISVKDAAETRDYVALTVVVVSVRSDSVRMLRVE